MAKHSWQKILDRLVPQSKLNNNVNESKSNLYLLAEHLDISQEKLLHFKNNIGSHYHIFKVDKKSSERREIYAPSPSLKDLQYKILEYLQSFPTHSAVTGFKSGGSIIVNACAHLNQLTFLITDIKDFFGSTCASRVREFFAQQGWERESLDTLVSLCTFNGGLPQGAPSSPCLSNILNNELDEIIYQLAANYSATYTRYGDDLAFSWPVSFIHNRFQVDITQVLLKFGYEISAQKGWKTFRAEDEPEITGIILTRDGKLRVPQRIHDKLSQLYLQDTTNYHTQMQIKGYNSYIKGIELDQYDYLYENNQDFDSSYNLPF
ncbi:reverse transcriptase domain-containing protein [Candidatus Uabimicrobium sp. HlEnr_7]|uniref:reverse transcriptase domain-containing protein n=1 Tax=Candidatus Uabimicrobium helgolandensis TaxID=3095367 RepID=UPI0035587854